mgnify:CR=1 FL=1
MTKERLSRKKAVQICDYGISYCSAQYLLNDLTPWAYVAGVYGWSCDIYNLGSVNISTGYCPVGKRIDYDTVRKYEVQAEKVVCEETNFEKRSVRLQELREELLKELRNHESG